MNNIKRAKNRRSDVFQSIDPAISIGHGSWLQSKGDWLVCVEQQGNAIGWHSVVTLKSELSHDPVSPYTHDDRRPQVDARQRKSGCRMPIGPKVGSDDLRPFTV